MPFKYGGCLGNGNRFVKDHQVVNQVILNASFFIDLTPKSSVKSPVSGRKQLTLTCARSLSSPDLVEAFTHALATTKRKASVESLTTLVARATRTGS